MRAITQQEFTEHAKANPYFRGRWPYISVALEEAAHVRPKTVLEIGTNGLRLFDRSDTLDIEPSPGPSRLAGSGVDYAHDAGKPPWPIADGAYDLAIALQVWEHLGASQSEAFEETMRVARAAILSFPYKWRDCNERHDGIDLERIEKWTCGVPQSDLKLVGPKGRQRIVMLWRFR